MEGEVKKICEFLKGRGVEDSVIQRFKEEKMDFAAVQYASDDALSTVGLTARGDIFALKSFAGKASTSTGNDQESREDKKRKLLQFIKGSKGREKITRKNRLENKTVTRRFNLGWIHFDDKLDKYVPVRYVKGGGSREGELPENSNKDDIIDLAKTLFFPDNISSFGNTSEMDFELGNFSQTIIQGALKDDSGREIPFTLKNYFKVHRLSRVRLYLMTNMSKKQPCGSKDSDKDASKTDDDDEFPPLDQLLGSYQNRAGASMERTDASSETGSWQNSKLLGTTWERNALRERQDDEYSKYLQRDREKQKEKSESNRLEKLRQSRLSRVPREPEANETTVLVVVQHLTQGLIKRNFEANESMVAIYDWVGSFTVEPEHYTLFVRDGLKVIMPAQSVLVAKQNLLLMQCCTDPLPLSCETSEQDVTFLGFGPARNIVMQDQDTPKKETPEQGDTSHQHAETTVQVELEPVTDQTPDVLLVEDASNNLSDLSLPPQTINNSTPGRRFRQMVQQIVPSQQERADEEAGEGEDIEFRQVKVRRSHIVQDVLRLYSRDETLPDHKINVCFQDESGMDFGGLTEDMYSSFWEEASDKYFDGDGVVKVPFVPPQRMPDSKGDMKLLGRILVHSWRLTKKLPIRFCEASLVALIHGEEMVNDDTLYRSFLWFVSQFERDVLHSSLKGEKSLNDYDSDYLLAIYQRFGMRCAPASTKTKLKEHVVAMAQSEFVFKPLCLLMWMRNGIDAERLANLKQSLSISKIGEIYIELYPTSRKVIERLKPECEDLNPEQQRVFNFLRSYIGNMDSERLLRFLRFVTGATCAPQKTIKVCFNGANGLNRVPNASTCSSTLSLPTTYERMTEFRREFDLVLMDDESFAMTLT